jgi:hypothetical protein
MDGIRGKRRWVFFAVSCFWSHWTSNFLMTLFLPAFSLPVFGMPEQYTYSIAGKGCEFPFYIALDLYRFR